MHANTQLQLKLWGLTVCMDSNNFMDSEQAVNRDAAISCYSDCANLYLFLMKRWLGKLEYSSCHFLSNSWLTLLWQGELVLGSALCSQRDFYFLASHMAWCSTTGKTLFSKTMKSFSRFRVVGCEAVKFRRTFSDFLLILMSTEPNTQHSCWY